MKVIATGEPFRKGTRVRDATDAAAILVDMSAAGVVEAVSADGTRINVALDGGGQIEWMPAEKWWVIVKGSLLLLATGKRSDD